MTTKTEEIVIPKDLQEFLGDIVEGRHGFKLGEPWKYSEKALAVVVPIVRTNMADRERSYVTMYEVLKELGVRDTGRVGAVEMQNRTGKAVFVRAGSIFEGPTQSRAAENSTVLQPGKEGAPNKTEIPVRCVHQTHGIRPGSDMKFGDIAPISVTMNLISNAGQCAVWNAVRRYTSGDREYHRNGDARDYARGLVTGGEGFGSDGGLPSMYCFSFDTGNRPTRPRFFDGMTSYGIEYCATGNTGTASSNVLTYDTGSGSDNLLGYMRSISSGRAALDEMMQKVPLFEDQVGAIIFNPVGVVAVETFDHPKSWEAIKKEVIERHGDKIMEEQAEHLFELKPDMILPAFKKFVDGLKKNTERIIRKDGLSETRVIIGEGVVGEYTLVRNRVIHAILVREEN